MLLCKIGDFSDSVYVNFYRAQAEQILGGTTAETLKTIKESGDLASVTELFMAATFRHFTFTIRAQARTFNDETRLSFSCTKT